MNYDQVSSLFDSLEYDSRRPETSTRVDSVSIKRIGPKFLMTIKKTERIELRDDRSEDIHGSGYSN